MREMRIFRKRFARLVAREDLPNNPWEAYAKQPASAGSRWQDEVRPGLFSGLVYGCMAAALVVGLVLLASGGYQDPMARDIAARSDLVSPGGSVQDFVDNCSRLLASGLL